MTETLGDLLRRSADAVAEPRFDVRELVAAADRRQRRRRLAVVATTAAVVGVVVAGSFVVRADESRTLDPAPSPPPAPPGTVAVDPTGTRPLVYAEGSTVHVGDESFDAGGDVKLVDVTDDGVVFVTEDRRQPQLWFHDDAATVLIGLLDWTTAEDAYAPLRVDTPASGSLVVWRQTQLGDTDVPDRYIVYDTSLRAEVARIPASGGTRDLQLVSDGVVYFGPRQHVVRFDATSGTTADITRSTMDAELAAQTRLFTAVTGNGDVTVVARPRFEQLGSRFVATLGDEHDASGRVDVTRTNGQQLRLRLPDGYHVPSDATDTLLSYWLDDDRIVIGAGDGAGDVAPKTGDALVCRLPAGVCQIAHRDVTVVGPRY